LQEAFLIILLLTIQHNAWPTSPAQQRNFRYYDGEALANTRNSTFIEMCEEITRIPKVFAAVKYTSICLLPHSDNLTAWCSIWSIKSDALRFTG
jgi:hypothetical protein